MQNNTIVSKTQLNDSVWKMVIYNPELSHKHQAGQFVIIHAHENAERIPLTIADTNKTDDTFTIIIQTIGDSTKEIAAMNEGDIIKDIAGPLGTPTHIEKVGTVVVVGGGVGVAPLYPIAHGFKNAGNTVIAILGGRNEQYIILREEFTSLCSSVLYTTDDGSLGERGVVTNALETLINTQKIDLVVSAGPVIMMKFVSQLTKQYAIPTMVSLNPIMIDGTGMCGSCRVSVGNETKFTCTDGPEFDGHLVNYDELMQRLTMYADHKCRINLKTK